MTTAWRSLIALNAVSLLAQLGQFGLGATLLPLALQARGAGAGAIGLVGSAFWLGMLAGLLSAGWLLRAFGYRGAVAAGVGISALAFVLTPALPLAAWALPSAAIGLGLGWRWIGNETWLYRLAPSSARGRVVGVHETLIGVASVAGPAAVALLGTLRPDAFHLGAAACLAALLPLMLARTLAVHAEPEAGTGWRGLGLGAWIAGLGGWMEGSLLSQLGVALAPQGLDTADTARLLTVLGIGGMLCQVPLGWCADRLGVRRSGWICAGAAALATAATLLAPGSLPVLAVMAFTVGGASAGLLTLGMVHAAQGADAGEIARRVRQVSLVYTGLSACGPALAGLLIESSGRPAWLWWQQALLVALLALLLRRDGTRPAP
ncbi:hypothetical protein CLD22_06100 [Rubrivivax gelatinosus]|nr:hypothetical protein [Rubrivivax gelatinosus]